MDGAAVVARGRPLRARGLILVCVIAAGLPGSPAFTGAGPSSTAAGAGPRGARSSLLRRAGAEWSRLEVSDGDTIDVCLHPMAGRCCSILVLTDVYGVRDQKNQEFMAALARRTGAPVLAPDLFRGAPWDEETYGGDTRSAQYEEWRRKHYVPVRVLADIADAARFARKQGCDGRLAVVGFCFGGGRMLEAMAGGGDLGGEVAAAAAFYPTRVDNVSAVCRGLSAANVPLLIIQGDNDDISTPELATGLGCTRVDCDAPMPANVRCASLVMQVPVPPTPSPGSLLPLFSLCSGYSPGDAALLVADTQIALQPPCNPPSVAPAVGGATALACACEHTGAPVEACKRALGVSAWYKNKK
jgi:dienelactone hydrolase